MNSEVCLSCEAIERYLGEEEERVHALRGVSLEVEAGSVHAVVGPSGCGKSSLLYILGLLDAVGLGDKLRRPSRHLSGGEQQRVAIARALANDPRVILADEPTGNLDTANSERAFELLQSIVRAGGKALLLATHNPVIAEACDWVHQMKDGCIIASRPRAIPGSIV